MFLIWLKADKQFSHSEENHIDEKRIVKNIEKENSINFSSVAFLVTNYLFFEGKKNIIEKST